MKPKQVLISLAAAGVLGAAGFGLYEMGMEQGLSMSPVAPAVGATEEHAPAARVDPSTWGIAEGEAATRRHIAEALKAGMVDPVTGRTILYYHDPMVPGKKFEVPGKSPFMDMMLVPAYAGAEGADESTVTISPRIQQNIGLRTALVSEAKGQPLVDLYVPDWVAAQEDFLSVRRMRGTDLADLVDAARARMRQVGMNEAQIRRVESAGRLQPTFTVRAPIAGAITELMAREGMTVMPGMTLVRINGLATVWANAEVPESQASQIPLGARVTATSPALPSERFDGSVQALLPEVNPETRTMKARMVLSNPRGRLVPGMFVRMNFANEQENKRLLVPTEAIIATGKRSLVMLAEDGGRFRPAEVVTGLESGGQTEIRQGLQAGQRVVLSGQFLIDSEASLKGIEARLSEEVRATADIHRTRALIEAITDDGLTLSHPAIESLRWPAMTMDFKLAPALEAPKLAPGEDIDIEFRMQEGGAPQIVAVRRVAAGAGTGATK